MNTTRTVKVETAMGVFTLARHIGPDNVSMSHGLSDARFTEPTFQADVFGSSGQFLGSVHNSTLLCLPGAQVRAPLATNKQIVAAVVGDEHVYDTEANGSIAAAILGADCC